MRVAWLTPFLPAPPNSGGRIRIGALAESLASEELVLFSVVRIDDEDAPRDGEPFGPFARAYTRPQTPPGRRVLASLPTVIRAFPKELSRLVAAEHRQTPWDLVIIEHCYAFVDLPPLPGARIILDEHNIESTYWRRQLIGRPLELPANLHQYVIWRRFEVNAWRKVDAVAVVAEEDAAMVRKIRPDSGVVFPNGVNLDGRRYIAPSERRGSRVLFVGSMGYEPNIQAAILLARQILPELRQLVPDATLTIAGRDPSPTVRDLANSFVRVTGPLPDLRETFDAHAAFAMPVELGAGSSLKALEALACGIPLVASPFAVRGHPLIDGVHYVEAHPRAMPRAIAAVLTERAKFDAMAEAGRAIAESLSWRAIGARFATFARVLSAKEPGPVLSAHARPLVRAPY
jgi:glycosyltransferase involved in cell wall biosynthesis